MEGRVVIVALVLFAFISGIVVGCLLSLFATGEGDRRRGGYLGRGPT